MIRRACGILEVDRSTYHYKPRRRDQAGLEARIKEIAEVRVRYGYRRVHVLLRREGWIDNVKRVRRIYRELGLQLRKKPPKRRIRAKLRADRPTATRPNDMWAMDFVHDQLVTGQKLRVLTMVDTFSRSCPGLDVRFRYRAEFVSHDLDLWAYAKGVELDFSRPGKPTDNAFIEAFDGHFRAECLNQAWFLTLADAREKVEAWRSYYNDERSHGAIGNIAPAVLLSSDGATSLPSKRGGKL